jgi:TPR repeat protein
MTNVGAASANDTGTSVENTICDNVMKRNGHERLNPMAANEIEATKLFKRALLLDPRVTAAQVPEKINVLQDGAAARNLYQQASTLGHVSATLNLAALWAEGIGGPADRVKAYNLRQKIMDHDADALFLIALDLIQGIPGHLSPNLPLAASCMQLAADRGMKFGNKIFGAVMVGMTQYISVPYSVMSPFPLSFNSLSQGPEQKALGVRYLEKAGLHGDGDAMVILAYYFQ